jgi:hypothetical protein
VTVQGAFLTFVGAILSYCGVALMINHRGFADWFQDAERRRGELSRGGTVWRPDKFGSPGRFGFAVLLLGLLFILGGVTS